MHIEQCTTQNTTLNVSVITYYCHHNRGPSDNITVGWNQHCLVAIMEGTIGSVP